MQNKQKLVKTITLSLLLGVGTWCTGTALAAEELSEIYSGANGCDRDQNREKIN